MPDRLTLLIDTTTLGLDGFSIMDMVPASEVVQGMQVVGGTDGADKYNLTTDDVADLQEKLFGTDGTGKIFAYSDKDGNTAFLGLDKDGNWTGLVANNCQDCFLLNSDRHFTQKQSPH
ncbi:TPA: hypothetical protein ACWL6U_003262 [Morganella morganii]